MGKSDEYIENALDNTDVDLEKLEHLRKKKKENKDILNKNIRRILLYSGFIGAVISAVSYLVATFVMIKGVSANLTIQNQILFSVLGAVVGVLIATLLMQQGVIYAKQNPEVQDIMKNYTTEVNKSNTKKEPHMIGWYFFWATVRNILFKGVSVALSTYLIVYIFIEGSGNWALLWLAISNIGLFTGFGLASLAKMYENYIEKHIPAVIARTNRLREKERLKNLPLVYELSEETKKKLEKIKRPI